MPMPPELIGRPDGIYPNDEQHIERWLADITQPWVAAEYERRMAEQLREWRERDMP